MCQVSYSKKTDYKSKQKIINFKGTPKWAFIEITNKCSHKCSWCYGGFDKELKEEEISIKDFKLLTKKLKEIGILQITLSGGEPTNHSKFEDILSLCDGFITNITSHGEWDEPYVMAKMMKKYNVNQVQFNYQGSDAHDNIHQIRGSFNSQLVALHATKSENIEVVGSLTVGKYNLDKLEDIFNELNTLDVDRLRVWETTGYGNKFRKDIDTKEIFDKAELAAKKLGYNYIQSYEPLVEGDMFVPCIAMQGMAMHINYKCEHIFCGAVSHLLDKPLSNIITNSVEEILNNYKNFINTNKENIPFCMSRRALN